MSRSALVRGRFVPFSACIKEGSESVPHAKKLELRNRSGLRWQIEGSHVVVHWRHFLLSTNGPHLQCGNDGLVAEGRWTGNRVKAATWRRSSLPGQNTTSISIFISIEIVNWFLELIWLFRIFLCVYMDGNLFSLVSTKNNLNRSWDFDDSPLAESIFHIICIMVTSTPCSILFVLTIRPLSNIYCIYLCLFKNKEAKSTPN